MIDYFGLIKWEGDNREFECNRISKQIVELKKELNLPVVILSQINREGKSSHDIPSLSQLRYTGALEEDIDIAIMIHRVGDDSVQFTVKKNKNGMMGDVLVKFNKQQQRFEDVALETMIKEEEEVPF